MKANVLKILGAAVALSAAVSTPLPAQAPTSPAPPAASGSIEPDGTVVVPSFRLPPSIYVSDRAHQVMPRTPTDPEAMMLSLPPERIGPIRLQMPQIMAARLTPLAETYHVTTRAAVLAGLPAVYATPSAGVPRANANKILLNLPGGGFVMGVAAGTGMIESIPLAGLLGVEIVSVTYRQGPEFRYPAATDDIVAVYRELLRTHRPQDIAIFGCSAGGLLTAQAIARFQRERLPLPAAIGIFCASADARWGGDSRAFGRPFQALPAREGGAVYFQGANLTDPLASPIRAPDLLAHFPPTLIVTATRAMEMSAAVSTHRALLRAGVDSELQMWDGLGHAFFYDASLPESREAFEVMARFFRAHLRLAPPSGSR